MPRRRFTSVFAFLVLAALFASRPLHAKDYYLGSQASKQGGTAVANIAALNALVLRPGDTVSFQGGESFAGPILLEEEDAGTSTQPIVIKSYGTGRATILGGTGSALKIYNAAGYTIRDLDLVGSGADTNNASGLEAGVYLPDNSKLDHLRFERMKISGFKTGVEIWAWYSTAKVAYPGFRNVSLLELEVCSNRSDGIKSWGTWITNDDGTRYSHSDFYIADCRVYDNRGDPTSTSHTGSGIVISGVDRGTIEYCVAHDNGGRGPATGGGPFGIWVWEVNGFTLQHNLVYNQKSSSNLDGGAYDLDGGSSNCVVQYNYSYNNEGPAIGLIQFSGASPLAKNVVRYNISENDARKCPQGALFVAAYSSKYGVNSADIYGNTFYVSANPKGLKPAVAQVENHNLISGVRVRNNLFHATHNGALITGVKNVTSKVLYQGNNYYGGSHDMAAFRTGGQELLSGAPVGSRVDPKLCAPGQGGTITDPLQLPAITAYRLQSGSPLASSGLDLARLFNLAPGTHDFFAQPFSSALPVGAAAAFATEAPVAKEPLPLVSDTFTGSGSISGRTPDSATYAASKWILGQGAVNISNGVATSTNDYVRATINAGHADATVQAKFTLPAAGGYAGLSLRAVDTKNFYFFRFQTSGWVFARVTNGTATTIASGITPFALNKAYTLQADCRGNTITLFIDGVQVHTSTQSAHASSEIFGITSGTKVRFICDNFTVMP